MNEQGFLPLYILLDYEISIVFLSSDSLTFCNNNQRFDKTSYILLTVPPSTNKYCPIVAMIIDSTKHCTPFHPFNRDYNNVLLVCVV